MAVILLAIADYRAPYGGPGSYCAFQTAMYFLYPETLTDHEEFQHWCWVAGVEIAWLRDRLDEAKPSWDAERNGKNARSRTPSWSINAGIFG